MVSLFPEKLTPEDVRALRDILNRWSQECPPFSPLAHGCSIMHLSLSLIGTDEECSPEQARWVGEHFRCLFGEFMTSPESRAAFFEEMFVDNFDTQTLMDAITHMRRKADKARTEVKHLQQEVLKLQKELEDKNQIIKDLEWG